jgi:hypothetical protein
MTSMKLQRLEIKPINEKTGFRFRLWFPGRRLPVEFETSVPEAGVIGKAILRTVERNKSPTQPRPRGRPQLRIVGPND